MSVSSQTRAPARILLVTDRPGWAFDFIADAIITFADDRFSFEKIPKSDFDPQRHGQGFDAWYFFWWGSSSLELVRASRIPLEKTMTVISSFNGWQKKGWDAARLGEALRPWSAVGVISTELQGVLAGQHPRLFRTRHGIDPARFRETTPIPDARPAGELVVGWAGSLKYAELKGLHDVLEPAVAAVPGARLQIASGDGGDHPAARAYPQARMADFYNEIDVYVCASRNEGAPLTVLEAGACGRPVISTRVGIVPELIEDGTSGRIVARTVDAVAGALAQLQADRTRLTEMGKALQREVLANWIWSTRVREYEAMFDAVLEQSSKPRLERWMDRILRR